MLLKRKAVQFQHIELPNTLDSQGFVKNALLSVPKISTELFFLGVYGFKNVHGNQRLILIINSLIDAYAECRLFMS